MRAANVGYNNGQIASYLSTKRASLGKCKILMKNAKSKTNEASDGQTEMKVNLNTLPILITVFKNSQRQGQAGESVQCDGLNNIILVARENVSPNHEAFKLEFKTE